MVCNFSLMKRGSLLALSLVLSGCGAEPPPATSQWTCEEWGEMPAEAIPSRVRDHCQELWEYEDYQTLPP